MLRLLLFLIFGKPKKLRGDDIESRLADELARLEKVKDANERFYAKRHAEYRARLLRKADLEERI